jgi:hypothetical protein
MVRYLAIKKFIIPFNYTRSQWIRRPETRLISVMTFAITRYLPRGKTKNCLLASRAFIARALLILHTRTLQMKFKKLVELPMREKSGTYLAQRSI